MLGSMSYRQVLSATRANGIALTDRARTFARMLDLAVDCHKVVYRRRKYALHAANKVLDEFGASQEPYECPHCHFWHLRSRNKKRRNAKKGRRVNPIVREALIALLLAWSGTAAMIGIIMLVERVISAIMGGGEGE